MQLTHLVPIQEYLTTDYEPDCDYVDGVVEERNLGERQHSELQGHIYVYFFSRAKRLRVYPYLEWRIQISPTRYRVADICLVAGSRPKEPILSRPPFLVIEILSPEDRLSRIQKRIDDYLGFGVAYVWLIDPDSRRAWVYAADGISEAKDGILRTENPALELPLPAIFQAIDEVE